MKTFKQFLNEAHIAQRIVNRAMQLANIHRDDKEKLRVYINLLRKAKERIPKEEEEYPGRTAARKDKNLIPSHRTSSFPELANISTVTKNPKKLRKQRAIGENPNS